MMLVLLIMLIVTLPPRAPCGEPWIRRYLPGSRRRRRIAGADPHRVDFDGRIAWNGVQVSRAELREHLAVEFRRTMQPEIHIEPHRRANYGVVAHVMAAAQREGLKKMGVIGGTLESEAQPHCLFDWRVVAIGAFQSGLLAEAEAGLREEADAVRDGLALRGR